MKILLAVTLLLVVAASTTAYAIEPPDQNSWRLYLKASDPNDSYAAGILTICTATNAVDGYQSGTGDTQFSYIGGFQDTQACVIAIADNYQLAIDAMSTKSPGNSDYAPTHEKIWSLSVANFPHFAGPTIHLKLSFVSAAAGIPPSAGHQYFIRMVDNKGVANAPSNGTVWDITMPATYTSGTIWSLDLPMLPVAQSNAGMLNGYQMEFVQTAVPEPSSLMAGMSLISLAGLAFRRQKH